MGTKFRKLTGTPLEVIKTAFESPLNPIIVIDNSEGELAVTTYFNGINDKLSAIHNKTDDQIILLSWTGKFKTDVFIVTPEDITLIING